MHPLVAAILLRVARGDALEMDSEAQPPVVRNYSVLTDLRVVS
jgi:hypothetical protein